MDCHDSRYCPGDCDDCAFFEPFDPAVEHELHRRRMARASLACFALCGLLGALAWAAAHLGAL